MKTSEKVIERLRRMGVINVEHPLVFTHRGNRWGSFSWVITSGIKDIGSSESMKTCLSWKRWIYSPNLHEIFEYVEGVTTVNYRDVVEE